MTKSVYIICHRTDLDGPIDYYERYLIDKNYSVLKLSHPLPRYKVRSTTLTRQGKNLITFRRFGPEMFNLCIDFSYTCKNIPRSGIDTVIAANNFDSLSAIFAKLILRKKIRKIVYFASDYSENRYKFVIMNGIYNFIEKIALKYSDLTVSNTDRAATKRKIIGLSQSRSIVVPNGVHLNHLMFSPKEISKSKFVYVGTVTKEHGLLELIATIQSAIKELTIIGSGDDLDRVVRFCEGNAINYNLIVNASHDYVLEYLQKFRGFGLAPYNLESKWTYYSSPLKINEYVACGVPVIVSRIPEISSLIDIKKYGVVYDKLDSQHIMEKIHKFNTLNFYIKSEEFYSEYNSFKLLSNISI
jgi:glycosyltransferase involved in cell wall biosynthesis